MPFRYHEEADEDDDGHHGLPSDQLELAQDIRDDEQLAWDIQAALDVEAMDNELEHLLSDVRPASEKDRSRSSRSSKGKAREQNGSTHDVVDLDFYNARDSHPYLNRASSIAEASTSTASDASLGSVLREKEREIASIDAQISELQQARSLLVRERESILADQRKAAKATPAAPAPARNVGRVVNYNDSSQFSWHTKLSSVLTKVFGITKLRLCQEGVLNAVLDGRDVICIMPTGGGKSICFQAPALLSKGTTLVISPLLSLMADQVMHLKEKGVNAVMITGSTGKEEMKEITASLLQSDRHGIKLCYVTPEKLAKSKTFVNTLSKMYDQGLLARIAIDESHCCSQLGHDFRPDYKKLNTLKQLFSTVPIIALTATCGRAVLDDVVRILRLKACTAGEYADTGKTVFFSAPLYRKNLHYSVRQKPAAAGAVIQEMCDEILLKHPNDTGIIYCLSQKDTATVAEGLMEVSGGKIRTATYHAGMDDGQKQRTHERWRSGKIKCIVATIAFGLGIDAPDVRYVYHHCISKSMEGYYQETGRAGRDGNDSDCVLWFRPADAARLSSLTFGEVEGPEKLYKMLTFALDYTTCRKLLFDAYFGNPASVVAPYTTADKAPCGHCDNCLRTNEGASSAVTKDVTLEAWKACKILREMDQQQGRVTLQQACDLVRGLGKGSFNILDKGQKGLKGFIDLQQVCGGKVALDKDEVEALLLKLLLEKYLKEDFHATAYTTICKGAFALHGGGLRNNAAYIKPGPGSSRLTRLSRAQLEDSGLNISITTLSKGKTKRGGKKKAADSGEEAEEDVEPPKKRKRQAAPAAKLRAGPSAARFESDDDDEDEQTWEEDEEIEVAVREIDEACGRSAASSPRATGRMARKRQEIIELD